MIGITSRSSSATIDVIIVASSTRSTLAGGNDISSIFLCFFEVQNNFKSKRKRKMCKLEMKYLFNHACIQQRCLPSGNKGEKKRAVTTT